MADITKCYGDDCPIKNKCYRYTAFANYDQQSYFTEIPVKTKDGKFMIEAKRSGISGWSNWITHERCTYSLNRGIALYNNCSSILPSRSSLHSSLLS